MESTPQQQHLQPQPLDSLDAYLVTLDYYCESPALQLPDLAELHDFFEDNPLS